MRFVLVCLLLGACVPVAASGPTVREARLSDTMLTLVVSDGSICRLRNWPAAPSGRLDVCLPGHSYAVRVVENPNVLRQIWTGLTSALGAEGAVPPMAEVVITDPAGGRRVFASPPPVGE